MGQCQTKKKDDETRPPDGTQWREKSPLLHKTNNNEVTSDTRVKSNSADDQDPILEESEQMEGLCRLYQRIIDSEFLGADLVACKKKGATSRSSSLEACQHKSSLSSTHHKRNWRDSCVSSSSRRGWQESSLGVCFVFVWEEGRFFSGPLISREREANCLTFISGKSTCKLFGIHHPSSRSLVPATKNHRRPEIADSCTYNNARSEPIYRQV